MLIQADLVITKDGEDTTTPLPLARIFQQYQECGIAEIFIEEQLELLRSAERSGRSPLQTEIPSVQRKKELLLQGLWTRGAVVIFFV